MNKRQVVIVKLIVAMAFPVSLLLGGCAGVTPSVSLGFVYTPNPTTSTSVSDGATKVDAAGWALGGTLEARFPYDDEITLKPCALVSHSTATTTTKVEDGERNVTVTANAIPGSVCLEIALDSAAMVR